MVAPPRSFSLASKRGPLAESELAAALAWGEMLAETMQTVRPISARARGHAAWHRHTNTALTSHHREWRGNLPA